MSVWEKYKVVNKNLKKNFFCIPPYQSVTGKLVGKLFDASSNNSKLLGMIFSLINNPWQRTFQFEYCYRECNIFLPFIRVIDYATYDAMAGNWICAYISLMPTIEAIIREWYKESPNLSFEGMKKSAKIIEDIGLFEDERKTITEEQIKYLEFIFKDTFFNRFDEYKNSENLDVFNRNLLLHMLKGVSNLAEGLRNISRLFLILDIISELYLMQEVERYKKYWFRSFDSNYEEVDFQLRWNLYKKLMKDAVYSSDLNIITNCYYGTADENEKRNMLGKIKLEMNLFEKMLDLRKKN